MIIFYGWFCFASTYNLQNDLFITIKEKEEKEEQEEEQEQEREEEQEEEEYLFQHPQLVFSLNCFENNSRFLPYLKRF